MDFGAILSRAWQIIWKYKILWLFGILAGCGGTTSTNFGNSGYRYTTDQQLPPGVQNFFNQFEQMPDWQIVLIAAIIILVVLVLAILFIFLGTVGRVGLIRGTQIAEEGRETISFGELFSDSTRYFWRVFLLNLLFGLAIGLIIAVLAVVLVLFSVVTLGIGLLCTIPLFCLLVPAGWALQVILEQANVALVVENLGIMDGLRRGWEVVKNNAGAIIVMSLILLLGVGLIGSFIIGLPLALVVVPMLGGAAIGTQEALNSGLLLGLVCCVAYFPVLLILGGILRAFTASAWTLTYMRLTGKTPAPLADSIPAPL